MLFCLRIILAVTLVTQVAQGQVAAVPTVGLRDQRPAEFAITGAHVFTAPGQSIQNATILVKDTSITAVGKNIAIPAGFRIVDCKGLTIYPGLIDAFSETEVQDDQSESAGHWNANVTPQRNAHVVAAEKIDDAEKLRSQGIAVRIVAPKGGIVKGTSAAVLLSDESDGRTLLKQKVWQHLQLSVPRGSSRSKYPNSPMGATALLRQTLYDATWYRDAMQTYQANPKLSRPETNIALSSLADAVSRDTFVIDAPNERMALRSEIIAKEFSLNVIMRGSGREYRDLAAISKTGRAILVPVSFPKKPDVSTSIQARGTTLQELMHWNLAPENPAKLAAAGVPICLTTDGLENAQDFLKQIRVAVTRGLSPANALAALTTTPARLIGIDNVGKIQKGMLANFVISDGDLFDDGTKIHETWVAGKQFKINQPKKPDDPLVGRWQVKFKVENQSTDAFLDVQQKDGKLSGKLVLVDEADASAEPASEKPNQSSEPNADEKTTGEKTADAKEQDAPAKKEPPAAKLTKIVRQVDRMTALLTLSDLDEALPQGKSRLTVVTINEGDKETTVFATIQTPAGETLALDIAVVEPEKPDQEEPKVDSDKKSAKPKETENEKDAEDKVAEETATAIPLLYPLGAYGREQPIDETPTVLFRGATLWTCDEQGILKDADVLIQDGRITAIGKDLVAPPLCHVHNAKGKHITPGLIDCHSHMGTDGGVNESGQVVTAEVRIGDFIDNSDINIYRQIAGGLTIANILHGSANPIGGQNQVIKLRWGQTMDGLRMKEAPSGIKFALGENVKRNTSRYPNTRMGVEQIFRDQFLAAREYDAARRRWRDGQRDSLPPRRDLQLDAIAQIQRGERWIHCHSYRQDEIVATLDVLEEFGIRIGTLQHILEGYKVADRMAKHGAMASAFSDWWAYKFEVFDAIPHNGALMHDQGVVVSFNSDDRELARHLNTEAAKAVKYGGVSPEEALKFVTINPAKQLRIDQHVGSLSVNKHADLVIWSGPPMSTTTRCEQTWIDGKRFFDLKSDAKMRKRDSDLHASLVQLALKDKSKPKPKPKNAKVDEEDRWARHDIYCSAHGEDGHQHTQWERQR